MIQAILIGLVGYFTTIDERYFGASMMNRPIIIGPVVGLILGDVHTGILIGASLEAMFIGIVTIGAALPPDVGVASTIATALAMKSGAGTDVAVALAMPFAVLAQGLNMLAFTINSFTVSKGRSAIKRRDLSAYHRWFFFPLIVRFPSAILTFVVVYFGANATQSFVHIIPDKIMTSFSVASGLLPAVGFAMLINGMLDKKVAPFFFIGYLLAAYLKVPVVGVAVAALMIALLMMQFGNQKSNA